MANPLFFRIAESLREQRRNLLEWWSNSSKSAKTLRLGDHPAEAVEDHLNVLDAAIDKADNEVLGICTVCHERVETHWLETNYTTCVCIEHLSVEERARLESELELSQKVQRALLPQSVPVLSDWELAAYSRPASIVSGDYFDFLRFKDGAPALVIADVMGKGMPASMLMASLQATLKIIVPEAASPEEVLVRANEIFCHNIYLTKFVSLAVMRLDLGGKTVSYANAGHNPPLLARATPGRESATIPLRPTGAAIGLVEDARFDMGRTTIEKGDVLLSYTDGVVESRSPTKEEFGEDRLSEFLAANVDKRPDQLIALLRSNLDAFCGGRPPLDDTTIVVGRRKP